MTGVVEHVLSVPGGSCRMRIVGEGPHALVFFPAVMDSAMAFGRVQLLLRRRLPAGVATVAVDPPGYGSGGEVPGFEAWPGFCAALLSELEARFSGRFVFAGNSSGAVAATHGAVQSTRTAGLVWICWCDWRLCDPRSHDLLCPSDEAGLRRLLARSWRKPPTLTPESREAMFETARRNRRHVASFDAEAHRQQVAAHRGPLLVVAGDADQLVTPEHARASALAYPSGRFECIAQSGHYPHREQPSALAELLAQFSSEVLAQGLRGSELERGREHGIPADQ